MFLGFASCTHCGRVNVGVTKWATRDQPMLRSHHSRLTNTVCVGSMQPVPLSAITEQMK